ncbi:MAG: 2-aminoadipate transaminase [Thermoleophilaceae bacterium]|nr:2-aminoadipate transaminase [Thermoleophilaceae bacterium]
MSYKLDLSHVTRDGPVSLTQQLVDLFVSAIEDGELEPGEKLPTTRALAADAGVNHLTAARVYRRLAETGYVTAQVGRGTFVRTLVPAAADERGDDWQSFALPDKPLTYADQVLDDAFRLAGEPGVISLSTGWPAPQLFPTEELGAIAADVFAEKGGDAISYVMAEGLQELREQIAIRGRAAGFAADADEIIVTSGARQAIDLACRTLLEEGDVAVVESPGFIGMLSSLRATGARVIGVPVDADGLDVDALERILTRHEVKLVALQPDCQNPTGRDLSPERRERLVALARERNFFILEDAVYADVRFEGEVPRPLREAAPGHVIYIDSLSKTVGGGLRIGWLAARGPVFERLAALKLESDFHTNTLAQHITARYLASGGYDRQLEGSLPFYRERRDALLAALERHLAGEYLVNPPHGGHHLWVTLTRPLEERSLYSEAVRHGVTFTPGAAVMTERPSRAKLRLSYSLVDPEQLDEGVRRLARAIRELRRRDRHSATLPVS